MVKAVKPITVGQSVSWVRRNGLPAKGKVLRVNDTASGPWIDVTVVGSDKPARVRPAVLTRKG